MKRKRPAISEDETPAVGDFVAVLPAREQYTGQPWIGKCLEYDTVQKKAKIMWYRGSYTTPWRPDKREQPSTVAAESIVVHGFQLTATGKLGTAVKNILKESVQDY